MSVYKYKREDSNHLKYKTPLAGMHCGWSTFAKKMTYIGILVCILFGQIFTVSYRD